MYLLYSSNVKPVGRALGRKLQELRPHGMHYGYRPDVAMGHRPIIRYGYSGNLVGTYLRHEVLQDQAAMQHAQNKYRSLQVMENGGVYVPPYISWGIPFPRRADGTLFFQDGKTYFLREFHHTRGTDISIVHYHRPEDLVPFDYAVEYVKSHKEYRIHVFDGRVILAQKKVFDEELFRKQIPPTADEFFEPRFRAEADMIRNYEHGYKFVIVNDFQRNIPVNVLTQALRAVNVLGLDFGAVDVSSLSGKDGEGHRLAIVWEVNTAPALETDMALTAYATAILNHNWSPRPQDQR